jgi:hypothetical protein
LGWPESILVGDFAEAIGLLQPEPASHFWIGFEKLVRSESIHLGKYAEIDILLL